MNRALFMVSALLLAGAVVSTGLRDGYSKK